MTENNKDLGAVKKSESLSIVRFVVTYVVLMGVFFLLIGLKPVQEVLDINGGYSNAIVLLTAKILGLIGVTSTYSGSLINLPSISLDVEFGCNGLEVPRYMEKQADWICSRLSCYTGFKFDQNCSPRLCRGLS